MLEYFNSYDKNSYFTFAKTFSNLLQSRQSPEQPLVIVCIGTDRATGDSLGPLVGYKLTHSYLKTYNIYGTLSEPIHAKNLDTTIYTIYKTHKNPFIIVIDASLGNSNHVGFVTLSTKPLQPGKGVNKELQAIGNVSITGIVNTSAIANTLLLQSTRLNTVMTLADYIFHGIRLGLSMKTSAKC